MARQDREIEESSSVPDDDGISDSSLSSDNSASDSDDASALKRGHSALSDSSRPGSQSSNGKPNAPKKRRPGPKPKARKDETTVMWNWQRKTVSSDRMSRLNFRSATVSDDGLTMYMSDKPFLKSGNFVYVMAEPVGEPYYVGRIMEFVRIAEPLKPDSDNAADLYQARLNWLYRPADLHKTAKNTRELLLTMHADLCPLASLRGRCTVKHRSEIGTAAEFAQYMQVPNNFWFDRLWDRYIERFFDVVLCENLVSLPSQIRDTLRSRYQYVVLEAVKTKELTSSISRQCKPCGEWATDEDSVTCARCDATYHMACLDPPLVHQPPRGFGWSCAACAQAVEQRFQDRQQVGPSSKPDKGSSPVAAGHTASDSDKESSAETAPIPTYAKLASAVKMYAEKSDDHIRQEALWPFRYLGIHSNLADAFDADDRIHPRAASRIGPKNQAIVKSWPGRPVVYFQKQVAEGRMRGRRPAKRVVKKEISPPGLDTSLPWVQEMPKGYLERGSDATSTLMWANDVGDPQEFLSKTSVYAEKLSLHPTSPNFLDACLKAFYDSAGNEGSALRTVATFTRKSLKEPTFTDEEVERFEEGVAKYGSELHDVYKHVGTQSSADITRFYYMWKKTPGGHEVWDNCQARLSRRKASKHNTDFTASIADTADPEITFSSEKIKKLQKKVECKHCHTHQSRKWKRASGRLPSEEDDPIEALCLRCARLWYRYGVVWQHPTAVLEALHARGAAKDKLEPELIEDAQSIVAEREKSKDLATPTKPAKKKKVADDADSDMEAASPSEAANSDEEESVLPDAKSEAIVTEVADESSESDESEPDENDADFVDAAIQNSYCAICCQRDPYMNAVQCTICNVVVHRACYNVEPDARASNWLCDSCSNITNPHASAKVQCSLCPCTSVSYIQWIQGESPGNPDLLRLAEFGRWVHQRCAVWSPKIRFGTENKRLIACGIADAIKAPSEAACDICKLDYAVDNRCDVCAKPLHAGCAGSKGYAMGFTIKPDDSGVRQTVVFNGESGVLSCRIRCPDHDVEDLIPMSDVDEVLGQSVMQLYVERYLQGEHHIGAMDRAEIVHFNRPQTTKRVDPLVMPAGPDTQPLARPVLPSQYGCATCGSATAIFWYNITPPAEPGAIKLQCPRCFAGAAPLEPADQAPVPSLGSHRFDWIIDNIAK